MSVPEKVNYLIIGAGIHGLSTAWHLAKLLKSKGKGDGSQILVIEKNAIASGAAESVLILAEETRSKSGRKLLYLAEKNRSEVIEISSHHHGGEMLSGLGGVAVILRYKLT